MAPFALFAKLATKLSNLPHCLELPYWHHQLVLSWYPHQPESHQLSLHKVLDSLTHSLSDGHPDTKIGPGIPGSDKNNLCRQLCHSSYWSIRSPRAQPLQLIIYGVIPYLIGNTFVTAKGCAGKAGLPVNHHFLAWMSSCRCTKDGALHYLQSLILITTCSK